MTIRQPSLWIAVILLIFATLLFIEGLADLALWQDEGWSIIITEQPGIEGIMDVMKGDNHPPLYSFTLILWKQGVGDSFFSLRVLSLLMSIFTVALTYRLALDMFDLRAAIAAAMIVITSDMVLSLGMTIRQYTPYMMLGILSTWLYWRYSRRWQLGWGIAYTISGVTLLYTLYWGPFILLAHGLHTLIFYPRRLLRIAIPALGMALVFAPWLPFLLGTMSNTGTYTMNAGGHQDSLPINKVGLEILTFQVFGVPEALFMIFAAAGVIGTFNTTRWRDYLPNSRSALAGLYFGLPLLIPMIATILGFKVLIARPMLGIIPALGLLVAHVLYQMQGWRYWLVLGIIVINNVTTVGMLPIERGPWWESSAILKTYASPGDVILIETKDFHAHVIDLHARYAGVPAAHFFRTKQIRNHAVGEQLDDYIPYLYEHDSAWVVEYKPELDLQFDLALLGFVPTTPILDAGVYVGGNTPIRRWARPPEGDPVAQFGDHMILADVDHFQRDGQLHVDLTWRVETAPGIDYTVSVFLLNSDGILAQPAQHDSFPLNALSPTSTWQPESIYFDRHNLDISMLPPGEYQLGIKVYTWQDGAIQVQTTTPCEINDCSYVVIDHVTIE